MEVLFTEEGERVVHSLYCTFSSLSFLPVGAYLFKAYSNGHPYDTSQVKLC